MTSLEPPPGRLVSLGEGVDRADAEDLLGVFRGLAAHQARGGRFGMNRAAREALWWIWEQRRLPRPLLRSKYPASYPWSPGARAALDEIRSAGLPDGRLSGVIVEHLLPARITMQEALERAPEIDIDAFIELLSQHGAAAVITQEEDRLLSAAGLASRMPDDWDGADVWARPRHAGLDPALFCPLERPEQALGTGRSSRNAEATTGHDPAKLELAKAVADRIADATGWAPTVTVNQITFHDGRRIPMRVQFWGYRVRLELGAPTEPALNPLAPLEPKQGKSGRRYWFVDDIAQLPADLEPLIKLAQSSAEPAPVLQVGSDDDPELQQDEASELLDLSEHDGGRRDFGTDVDAAMRHWGGYDKFAEGIELTHRVIELLGHQLGPLTLCWVPTSARYAGFRFTRPESMALAANWGYLWVTNSAVERMRDDGVNPLDLFHDARFTVEETWNDGLSIWTTRGLRDRASSVAQHNLAGRKCSDCSCIGANILQPTAECDYCGAPLA